MKKLFRDLWLLLCACVPGCGQMQQGYMKRGISQTIMFSAVLAVAVFLEVGALAILLAPLWLYSFFDAYNLRRMLREGAAPEDAYLFGLSDMDSRQLTELLARRHSLIGWALVAAGLLVLWRNVADILFDFLNSLFSWEDMWWFRKMLMRGVPRIAATLLLIVLGIWFIRGPRRRGEDPAVDYVPAEDAPKEPFTAKGPWSAEAQTPVTLQLRPDLPEEGAGDPEKVNDAVGKAGAEAPRAGREDHRGDNG